MKKLIPIIRSIRQRREGYYHRPPYSYSPTIQKRHYDPSSTKRVLVLQHVQHVQHVQAAAAAARHWKARSSSSSSQQLSIVSMPHHTDFTFLIQPQQHRFFSSTNLSQNDKRSAVAVDDDDDDGRHKNVKQNEEGGGEGSYNNHEKNIKYKKRSQLSLYLGANPQPDPVDLQQQQQQQQQSSSTDSKGWRKRRPLREAIPMAWNMYKSTWEGVFDNKNDNEEEDDDNNDGSIIDEEKIKMKQKEIRKNLKKNIKVLKEDGSHVVETVKETTGIRNKNDLIKWSMKQLKLANECVAEFMSGYRKGRDEEIEKVLNQYFKDFEMLETEGDSPATTTQDKEEEPKPGRRKRRRRSRW